MRADILLIYLVNIIYYVYLKKLVWSFMRQRNKYKRPPWSSNKVILFLREPISEIPNLLMLGTV